MAPGKGPDRIASSFHPQAMLQRLLPHELMALCSPPKYLHLVDSQSPYLLRLKLQQHPRPISFHHPYIFHIGFTFELHKQSSIVPNLIRYDLASLFFLEQTNGATPGPLHRPFSQMSTPFLHSLSKCQRPAI